MLLRQLTHKRVGYAQQKIYNEQCLRSLQIPGVYFSLWESRAGCSGDSSSTLPCPPAPGKAQLGVGSIQDQQSQLLPLLLALSASRIPLRSAVPASRAPEHRRNVM